MKELKALLTSVTLTTSPLVESGEGIESSDHALALPTRPPAWNPVKELKVIYNVFFVVDIFVNVESGEGIERR